MLGYVTKALHKFHHDTHSKPQHSPFKFVCLNYGSMVQYAHEPDNSPFLSPSRKTHVQQIVGTFLFILALSTILCSLYSIRFLLPNPNPPRQLIKISPNFLTTLPLILTPPSDILVVAWFYVYSAMHHSSVNQTQKVG